jgi:hypothetical protein
MEAGDVRLSTFSPRVIGRADKTFGAILGRQLAGTGLTEPSG